MAAHNKRVEEYIGWSTSNSTTEKEQYKKYSLWCNFTTPRRSAHALLSKRNLYWDYIIKHELTARNWLRSIRRFSGKTMTRVLTRHIQTWMESELVKHHLRKLIILNLPNASWIKIGWVEIEFKMDSRWWIREYKINQLECLESKLQNKFEFFMFIIRIVSAVIALETVKCCKPYCFDIRINYCISTYLR